VEANLPPCDQHRKYRLLLAVNSPCQLGYATKQASGPCAEERDVARRAGRREVLSLQEIWIATDGEWFLVKKSRP